MYTIRMVAYWKYGFDPQCSGWIPTGRYELKKKYLISDEWIERMKYDQCTTGVERRIETNGSDSLHRLRYNKVTESEIKREKRTKD
jgi:hypothetical protein